MQWLIDIIKAWIEAQGYLTTSFVDRGDHAVHDFTTGDFIVDGDWHDLDLSSIVAENAKGVAFRIRIKTSVIGMTAEFRTKGNIKSFNMGGINTVVADVNHVGDCIIPLKTDRKIEYSLFGTGLQALYLNVKGWWL